MSADNWTECPKCGLGVLREDYDIGIRNGTFEVSYSALCSKRHGGCGWSWGYGYTEAIRP